MVPKQPSGNTLLPLRFRAVLFRMVPKHGLDGIEDCNGFRAVLFRMVPKRLLLRRHYIQGFRAVLFRMVPKHIKSYSFFK